MSQGLDNNTRIRPSLLDRLTKPEDFLATGSTGFNLEKLKRSIQEDVEDLLNTKINLSIPEDVSPTSELYDSILTYGLPDMTTFTGGSEEQSRMMKKQIQEILTRFEPRLTRIKVDVVTLGRDQEKREVRFKIESVLNIKPYTDYVPFQTILELTTGHAKVTLEKS